MTRMVLAGRDRLLALEVALLPALQEELRHRRQLSLPMQRPQLLLPS